MVSQLQIAPGSPGGTPKLRERASGAEVNRQNELRSRGEFEEFSAHYQNLVTKEIEPNELRQMIKKFIHKVEVGTETVKIDWIVDDEHFERELTLKGAGSSLSGSPLGAMLSFKRNLGSQNLTFGAPW